MDAPLSVLLTVARVGCDDEKSGSRGGQSETLGPVSEPERLGVKSIQMLPLSFRIGEHLLSPSFGMSFVLGSDGPRLRVGTVSD